MNYKNFVATASLVLNIGCSDEIHREINNFHDIDGTWSSDVEVTIKSNGKEDYKETIEDVWVTFDQSGPSVSIFGHAGLATDRRVTVDSKREVYYFGSAIMIKVKLEGNISLTGGEISNTQDVLFKDENGDYESVGEVRYLYEFGLLTEVKNGAEVTNSEASYSKPVADLMGTNITITNSEESYDLVLQEVFSGHPSLVSLGRKLP